MLYAYNTATQSVPAGSAVKFSGVTRVDRTSTLDTDNVTVNLNLPGTYLVSVNADVYGTGSVSLQLNKNGDAVSGAKASATVSTSTASLSFTALVRVMSPFCSCSSSNFPAELTVINTGSGVSVTNAAVTVIRVA